MYWYIYLDADSFDKNLTVTMFNYLIDGELVPYPKIGDSLTIEYASAGRTGGTITCVLDEQIEVEVNGSLLLLKFVDMNQNNGKITLTYLVC